MAQLTHWSESTNYGLDRFWIQINPSSFALLYRRKPVLVLGRHVNASSVSLVFHDYITKQILTWPYLKEKSKMYQIENWQKLPSKLYLYFSTTDVTAGVFPEACCDITNRGVGRIETSSWFSFHSNQSSRLLLHFLIESSPFMFQSFMTSSLTRGIIGCSS